MIMKQCFDHFYLTDEKSEILKRCHQVTRLLKNAYWAKDRKEETMRAAIQNSLSYGIVETGSDSLIAFARVVTDHATVYYLCDVFIAEQFRGMGLGKKLISQILFRDEALRGLNGLLKTKDAVSFYEKFGFEECQSVCMVKNI